MLRRFREPGVALGGLIVVVGDRKSLEGPLAKLAPVELRDLDGEPVTAGAAETPPR